VLVSQKRDLVTTRRFFIRALKYGSGPTEVTTDQTPVYPGDRGVDTRRLPCHRAVCK
jgi:transposase-like protein